MVTPRFRLLLLAVLLAVGVLAPGIVLPPERAEAQSSRHEIPGIVVDEDGRPIERLFVAASPQGGQGQYERRTTAAGGAFRLWLVEGTYRLSIWSDSHSKCTVSGIENPEGRLEAVFPVEGEGVTPIRIVATTSDRAQQARWVRCYFDVPFYRVQGTVVGPDQEPLEGIGVHAIGSASATGPWTAPATRSDGRFAVDVPEGAYVLGLFVEREGGECRLGYYGAGGLRIAHSRVGDEETTANRIRTDGGDVTGATIRLRAPLRELCRSIQGLVTNSQGEPLEGIHLQLHGHGPSWFEYQRGVTRSDGTFHLYGVDGTYYLRPWTSAGSECAITDSASPRAGGEVSVVVDGQDIANARIVVSGNATGRGQWLECFPPPRSITTDLEPGWNLAGWTGPETRVSAAFAATPQLEAIHVWDADTQSFRGVMRRESGSDDSLGTLLPGMGLWLLIGGTETVSWTRPFLTESALVSLEDGWNLVNWGGRDGATAEEIFDSLGAEPVIAATWDATTQQFALSAADTPVDATPALQVRRGDALWLYTPAKARWLQPGWPAPDVVLLGGYPTGTEERYRRSVEGAQTFYAERYGVITSDVTFYFASDRESLENTYRQVRGRDPSDDLCANYGNHVIFTATYRCFPVTHEYFHAIQYHLAGNDLLESPTWIVEGSAVYTDFQRRYSRGTPSYETGYHFLWSSLGFALNDETASGMRASVANSIGYLAMEWLADEAGEGAILDYFANLRAAGDWREAFRESFGLPVADFYSQFEVHRQEVAPAFRWDIEGSVVDRHSQPMEGVRVFASRVSGRWPLSTLSVLTAADGSFSFDSGPGSGYVLMVRAYCENGAYEYVGALGQDGFTQAWRSAPHFAGEARHRTGILIELPITQEEFERDNCGS
ncbi:MAG: carboxypeptidase regulatory-like domain-containing protein [Dehalococcoidia bacterium]|nr:carboxypeptidase regulatory-like domain-containing protein [Dehalococcoidia bacterium]MYA54280.1 carboxypeptidase regulatory-like domain-containing protein [Dehalococcoidia bacterium]